MKTEYLSHQEYFKKRSNIIEDVKGISIDLTYNRGTNWVCPNTKKASAFVINICKPMEKGIDRKTALYHELSHLMWDSFVPNMKGLCGAWATSFINKHPNLLNLSSETKAKLRENIVSEYRINFNIIEDQRIESLTRNIWLGTGDMFDKTRDKLGERLVGNLLEKEEIKNTKDSKAESPADNLLLARFNQPSHSNDWSKDIMADVIGTNVNGGLVALVRAKKYIDAYMEKKLEDFKDKHKEAMKHHIEYENASETWADPDKNDEERAHAGKTKSNEYKAYSALNEEATKQHGEFAKSARRATQYSHDHNSLGEVDYESTSSENAKTEEEKLEHEEKEAKLIEDADELEKLTEEELKANTIEHKEDGKQEVESMKASIEAVGRVGSMLPSHIKMIDRTNPNPAKIDGKSATVLAKTFQKMAEQYVDHLDDQGSEIDIDSYINNRIKGTNDPCLVSEKLGTGATVLISIDGSGSMGNSGDLERARNLLATLYKASEKVKNIKLIANVWSSNYAGDVGVTIINSADDLDKIDDVQGYLFTPTHEALLFSAKQLRGQDGRKKLMIMITDGIPQYYKNQFEIPAGSLHKMCKTALKKSLRISPRIMCIDITNHWKYSETLRDIFGKRLITLDGMDSASKFVIKEFRKMVAEVMK